MRSSWKKLIPVNASKNVRLHNQTKAFLKSDHSVESWQAADIKMCETAALHCAGESQKRIWLAVAKVIAMGISANGAAALLDADFRGL